MKKLNRDAVFKIIMETHEEFLPNEAITHELSELYSIMAYKIVNPHAVVKNLNRSRQSKNKAE